MQLSQFLETWNCLIIFFGTPVRNFESPCIYIVIIEPCGDHVFCGLELNWIKSKFKLHLLGLSSSYQYTELKLVIILTCLPGIYMVKLGDRKEKLQQLIGDSVYFSLPCSNSTNTFAKQRFLQNELISRGNQQIG